MSQFRDLAHTHNNFAIYPCWSSSSSMDDSLRNLMTCCCDQLGVFVIKILMKCYFFNYSNINRWIRLFISNPTNCIKKLKPLRSDPSPFLHVMLKQAFITDLCIEFSRLASCSGQEYFSSFHHCGLRDIKFQTGNLLIRNWKCKTHSYSALRV